MTITQNCSVIAHRPQVFAAVERDAITASNGVAPVLALDFTTRDWRVAGRDVSAPLLGARLDQSLFLGATKGLVLEPERINLVYPSAVASSGWGTNGSTTIQPASGMTFAGLDGCVITSGGVSWGRAFSNMFTLTAGADFTVSTWIAAGTSGRARLELYGAGVDLIVEGTIGALAATYQSGGTISNLSQEQIGGLWRVSFQVTATSTVSNVTFGVGPSSTTAGQTVIAYAAQVENGQNATDYIQTTTAQHTRPADTPHLPLGMWFAPDKGGCILELATLHGEDSDILAFKDGSGTVVAQLSRDGSGSLSLNTSTHPATVSFNAPHQLALSWQTGTMSLALDGGMPSDTTIDLSDAATLHFGPAHARVSALYLYDRALSL
ncbi:phage head spike fiber domain-containing protein [Celeribacter sp.]|uniref:phage head spike fiber domain-containing protein n=1 Tax=Celeribacter sp. TaxID=1890673 RepID=UPI003A91559E